MPSPKANNRKANIYLCGVLIAPKKARRIKEMDSKKEALEIVDAALEELHYLNLNGEAELFSEQVAALGRPSNETLEEAEAGYAVGTLWSKAQIVELLDGTKPNMVQEATA